MLLIWYSVQLTLNYACLLLMDPGVGVLWFFPHLGAAFVVAWSDMLGRHDPLGDTRLWARYLFIELTTLLGIGNVALAVSGVSLL